MKKHSQELLRRLNPGLCFTLALIFGMTVLLSSFVTVIHGFSLNSVLRARVWKIVTEEQRV